MAETITEEALDLLLAEVRRVENLRNAPVQDRSRRRLEQIAAAGVIVWNRVGRDRLTTEMVAAEAGCSIGTIYRYFPDRVALFDHIAPDRDESPLEPRP